MPEECRQRTFVAPSGAKEMPLVRHGESRVATDERSSPLVNGHVIQNSKPWGVSRPMLSVSRDMKKGFSHAGMRVI